MLFCFSVVFKVHFQSEPTSAFKLYVFDQVKTLARLQVFPGHPCGSFYLTFRLL